MYVSPTGANLLNDLALPAEQSMILQSQARTPARQHRNPRPQILSSDVAKGRDGDRINAVLAAAGYDSLLVRWFDAYGAPLIADPCSRRLGALLRVKIVIKILFTDDY
jgi:hypothetical protein